MKTWQNGFVGGFLPPPSHASFLVISVNDKVNDKQQWIKRRVCTHKTVSALFMRKPIPLYVYRIDCTYTVDAAFKIRGHQFKSINSTTLEMARKGVSKKSENFGYKTQTIALECHSDFVKQLRTFLVKF